MANGVARMEASPPPDSDSTGATNDAKFDAILAKMDESALKRAQRDEKTTEHKDVNGSLKTAANQSSS